METNAYDRRDDGGADTHLCLGGLDLLSLLVALLEQGQHQFDEQVVAQVVGGEGALHLQLALALAGAFLLEHREAWGDHARIADKDVEAETSFLIRANVGANGFERGEVEGSVEENDLARGASSSFESVSGAILALDERTSEVIVGFLGTGRGATTKNNCSAHEHDLTSCLQTDTTVGTSNKHSFAAHIHEIRDRTADFDNIGYDGKDEGDNDDDD